MCGHDALQELIDRLTVERHTPLPPRPYVPDGPTAVLMRWEALDVELDELDERRTA